MRACQYSSLILLPKEGEDEGSRQGREAPDCVDLTHGPQESG